MKKQTICFLVSMSIILTGLLVSCRPEATPEAFEQATVETTPIEPVTLVFWWWGEEEAPGLEGWVDETAQLFEEEHPNVTVETVRQTVDGLIPATESALASQTGPDLLYFWPFFPLLKAMWYDGLAPLDDYIPEEVEHYMPFAKDYVTWRGKTYAVPFYSIADPWFYNKDLFAQAGLDPEKPPNTWEEWMEAGQKLKEAGIIPIAAGMKDLWYSDFPWLTMQTVPLDSEAQMFEAYLGLNERSMADPEFEIVWEKMDEMIKANFYPEDVMSLDLYEGFDLFLREEAATATPVHPLAVQWAKQMGPEKIGVFLSPTFGGPEGKGGKMANLLPSASQYIGITAWSPHKEEAAEFLKFTHTPERMAALYEQAGAMTPDDRFNTDLITIPLDKQIYEWILTNSHTNFYNSAPPVIDEWIWPWSSKLFVGEATPEEIAIAGEEIMSAWRDANPDMVEFFKEWKGLK